MPKKTTSVSLPQETLDWIQARISTDRFSSISHACNTALNALMKHEYDPNFVEEPKLYGHRIRPGYDEEKEQDRVENELSYEGARNSYIRARNVLLGIKNDDEYEE